MTDPVKRMNYFDGQFLRAQDFLDEQNYHLAMQRLHNSSLHTWGVASGLKLSFPSGATRVTVGQGIAIDGQGRELVLPNDAQTKDLSGAGAASTLFVTITYAEAQTNPVSETGATGNTRVQELPTIDISAAAPSDPSTSLILGTVTIDAKGVVQSVNNGTETNRRAAGAVGGDLDVVSLTLSNSDVTPTQWPRFTATKTGLVDLAAGLKIDGTLETTGTATFDSKVGIGTSAPQASLHVTGTAAIGPLTMGSALMVSGSNAEVSFTRRNLAAWPATPQAGDRYSWYSPDSSSARLWTEAVGDIFTVTSNGHVGIGTGAPVSELEIRRDNPGALGPRLTLINGSGGAGAGAAIDLSGYDPGGQAPAFRLQAMDDGRASADLVFWSKQPGSNNNALVERLRLNSDGRFRHPMWRATTVFNQQKGGLPAQGTVVSGGGTLVIIFSGAGWRIGTGAIGMNLVFDGSSVATTQTWTNEGDSHKAFPTNIHVQPDVPAGTHTIELVRLDGNTVTDINDYFNVTVLELPF